MSVHPEQQYLDLIDQILTQGHYRPSPHQPLPSQPKPPGTFSLMNCNMSFDLTSGEFPFMTVRKMYLRPVVAELIWFLSGSTNNDDLHALGAHFWDAWDTPETNQAMGWNPGQLGPIYGKQWRHWGARMAVGDGSFLPADNARFNGFDQITNLIDTIKTAPASKRLFVTAYDPIDAKDCFVTTCHGMFFCQVWGDRLNLHMVQRSGDVPIGIPFNIASYSLLLLMLAQVTQLKPGTFYHTISDAHIYENQVEAMKEVLRREPKPYPKLILNPKVTSIFEFTPDDVELVGYESHPRLDPPVAT